MSSKVKRRVTVENAKESSDQPRRPSVFERLGPGTMNLPSQSQDRHGRVDHNEKCRNWLRTGSCTFGNTCRYKHEPCTPPKRQSKSEKDIIQKDLRHKVRKQRDDHKGSRTGSLSPKVWLNVRKGNKRSGSRSRKGVHESKIKSTVVVTRPRSPLVAAEVGEKDKKKVDGSWEDDSDDWPMDAAQLDYKEELTLERKRQQLQRELELELQKERMLSGNANVTKTVPFSDSSSSSSSSDSGSISSSSDSSSSSSDDDSDDSSSSSSSSSSSASQAPVKKYKKPVKKESAVAKASQPPAHKKGLDDYDRIKNSRLAKSEISRSRSPARWDGSKKKGHDRRNVSPMQVPSPKSRSSNDIATKSHSHIRKGPRTPSPPPPPASARKHRQWGQSSSTDSRSADTRRKSGKRHKKKKESSKNERHKAPYVANPPRLSSPNRTALQPHIAPGKKSWQQRDEFVPKSHQKNKENSPQFHSRLPSSYNSPMDRHGNFYPDGDKVLDKRNKSKTRGHKSQEGVFKKGVTHEHKPSQRYKQSPARDSRQSSISPQQDRYEIEQANKKIYPSAFPSADKKRHPSASPIRHGKSNKDRKKSNLEVEKRRDNRESPLNDGRSRVNEPHLYSKKEEQRNKRLLSPDIVKGHDDKGKDRNLKDRASDVDWNDDHKKDLRIPEPRAGRLEIQASQISSSSRNDRSRDRDRKKTKDRDPLPLRDDLECDRPRLTSPHRVAADIHPHHPLREDPPVPVPRGHLYEPDLPPDERDYPYPYTAHHDPAYIDDRVLPPEYDHDLLQVTPLYPPETANYGGVYPDARFRRDVALKDPPHMERIVGYSARDISPLPRHEPVLPVREEDLPLDDRRAYDEHWGRNLALRDDWDPYPPLPPHVAGGLDDERYAMPRRRRSSPDWHLRRAGERDLSLRDRRSRSPQHRRLDDNQAPTRAPWREQGDRHGNRPPDSRNENTAKIQDDKKNRPLRRDRRDRDRSKKPDEHISESCTKPISTTKEKMGTKRSRSSTPQKKDNKRRKEDPSIKDDTISSDKGSSRKPRDEQKSDSKSTTSLKSSSKSNKPKSISPKPDEKPSGEKIQHIKSSDKAEPSSKGASKPSSKVDGDEKRKRNNDDNKNQVDDEFSDWSDGDDELLNRDLAESESNQVERSRNRSDDLKKEKSSRDSSKARKDSKERSSKQKRDGSRDSHVRSHELKMESRSRTDSKERSGSESSRKQDQPILSAKESDSSEAFVVEDEAVEDIDDFMMTESVDYDPISDGELEALIEEPDDSLSKSVEGNEDMKVVDALDVNWSALVNDTKPKVSPCSARRRYTAAHVLSRIGFSQTFAGAELSKQIIKFCQKQFDEEKEEERKEKGALTNGDSSQPETFQMEHPVAAFHVILKERKRERETAFTNVGPNRRALCARQDLHIRKVLCRPSSKLLLSGSTCVQRHGSSESNSELLGQPPVINATC